MDNKIPNEIVRGHINTVILSSLIDGDKYGYEIRKEIEAKSSGTFVLKEPTLYSSLKRLEKQGFVEAYYGESDETNGGRRKYYKLTEYGREVSMKNLNEWKYSRSLIDKLITEEKIDLENTPPPENLNLNLTKKVSGKYAGLKTESKDNTEDKKETREEKFVYNIETPILPPKQISKKDTDSVIHASQIQQNMFEKSDNEEKSDKEYKNLMEKLISSTKTHTAVNENLKIVEKVIEPKIEKEIKEEKVSHSLLPKGGSNENVFSKTQAKIQADGFKIRTFNPTKSASYRQFILINKLLLGTFLLTFLTMLIELLIVYLVFEKNISLGIPVYLIIAACLAVLPLGGAILCIINPNKKVKAKLDLKSMIINSLLIFGIGCILIISIRLAIQHSFVNLKDIVTGVVFPVLLLFNVLTGTFFYGLLIRSKKFHS